MAFQLFTHVPEIPLDFLYLRTGPINPPFPGCDNPWFMRSKRARGFIGIMHIDQTTRSGQVRPAALISGFPLLGIIFALFGVGVPAVPPPAGVAPLTSPA